MAVTVTVTVSVCAATEYMCQSYPNHFSISPNHFSTSSNLLVSVSSISIRLSWARPMTLEQICDQVMNL